MPQSTLTHLECSLTGQTYEADRVMNLAPNSQRPLLARYDLAEAAKSLTPENLSAANPACGAIGKFSRSDRTPT